MRCAQIFMFGSDGQKARGLVNDQDVHVLVQDRESVGQAPDVRTSSSHMPYYHISGEKVTCLDQTGHCCAFTREKTNSQTLYVTLRCSLRCSFTAHAVSHLGAG